ncbi:hypothetical protein GCM10010346_15440 [Streptomyces chryseus]|uniref:Uncharacterized protein n=1 Tax=Streptomyces chryseus TaxID=68186 RepID=A0ABQ3DI66_9ACTN|nr:hypothetical protein GCM10010346_15440 [Streptomyces chryseus]
MATSARTGSYVVRSGGSPVPAKVTDRTPRPATGPAKETRPGATARTGAPGPAARSTPRCPAAYREGGGSQDRRTGGRSPTGHTPSDGGVPGAGTGSAGGVPAAASGSGTPQAVSRSRIGTRTSTVVRRIPTPSRDGPVRGDHGPDLWTGGRLWTSPSPGTA